MKLSDNIQEYLLCLLAGILCVAWFIAMAMGDGSMGFLDLF